MYTAYALPMLGVAALAGAQSTATQGAGEGYPPPPPQTLETTKSGVLPVLPTNSAAFSGVELNEGAIEYVGKPNPTFTPVYGPATSATGLPMATYQADLPSTNFDDGLGSLLTGSIRISSSPAIPGVSVNVDFHGLAPVDSYGPYVYHVHALPVPADGNCTATLGHLDPTNRGEYYPCNPAEPSTCQVGDLSGKHGNVTTAPDFMAAYTDAFLSTDPASPAFVGGKSVVIHTSNATRITCANFVMMGGGMNGTMGGANGTMGNGTMPASPSYSGPAQTGAAGAATIGGAAMLAAVVGMVL